MNYECVSGVFTFLEGCQFSKLCRGNLGYLGFTLIKSIVQRYTCTTLEPFYCHITFCPKLSRALFISLAESMDWVQQCLSLVSQLGSTDKWRERKNEEWREIAGSREGQMDGWMDGEGEMDGWMERWIKG